jgi:hypothetical protein
VVAHLGAYEVFTPAVVDVNGACRREFLGVDSGGKELWGAPDVMWFSYSVLH